MRFAFDASVPDPGLAVEMENLADLMAAHPGCVLGVFGHADPVGSDDLNKHLSGRRAAAIYGLLLGAPRSGMTFTPTVGFLRSLCPGMCGVSNRCR